MVSAILAVIGTTLVVYGAARLLLLPLALAEEIRDGRRRRRVPVIHDSVSVIVPAHNEGVVVDACVRSIIVHGPSRVEVILVDDGSTDDTLTRMRRLEAELQGVRVFTQPNAGKSAALNRGLVESRGAIVMMVDADGVFTSRTFDELLRPFADPRIGAVCGDDRPINLDRLQTRFLAVIGHLGTGFMRRVQAILGVLPVVSGNAGAFRRRVLDEVGLLRPGCVGEDLELTWRVHRAGHRVAFAPRALVYAESASDVRGLWRQRRRWARGLFESLRIHRDMIGRPRFGLFGISLVPLIIGSVVLPMLQLAAIPLLGIAVVLDGIRVHPDVWSTLLWLGLPLSVALVLVAIALNQAWTDLRFLYVLPLWPVYSILMSLVMVAALAGALRGRPAQWHKLVRTGVRTVETATRPR